MKKLGLRFENIDNLKRTAVQLPQETIDYLDSQTGKAPYEYIKIYFNDNRLYEKVNEMFFDYVNKTLPDELKKSCQFCNGDSNDDEDRKCNNYHSEAQMNFFFASYQFVSIVERNKHLINDNAIRKKLTLQFYECFAFTKGRVIFDLEKMTMYCLNVGFLTLSRIFANNTTLQNLSIINDAIDELNTKELNSEMFEKEKPIYLDPQKKFFTDKYKHYKRKHFIEKEKTNSLVNQPKDQKNINKRNLQIHNVLFTYYLQESKYLPFFENHKKGKVYAINELVKENNYGSSKSFQNKYNSILKKDNRVTPKQIENLKTVITLLNDFPKAKSLASDELKIAELKR